MGSEAPIAPPGGRRHSQASSARLFAIILTLALLPVLATPGRAAAERPGFASVSAQQDTGPSLHTRYFTIFYPPGEDKAAQWYASFADDVVESVSDLLNAPPPIDLKLRIYATEADYSQANPIAENHPGIMAHAIPEKGEVGVAVERLRQQEPEVARESFRHEITHVIAGELSGQNLPVGFQEGLAQYDELSLTRAQDVVQAMQDAQLAGKPFLSWNDLNDTPIFQQNLDVAYPQAYSVMAFLADKYGMAPFARFLTALQRTPDWAYAMTTSYGKPVPALEAEWRDYLPSFYKEGWQHNLLRAYDLSYGESLLSAGQFARARDQYAASEKLYNDLQNPDKAQQAAQGKSRAEQALQAQSLATDARKALEAHDYASAKEKGTQAANGFSALNLPGYAQHASDVSSLASQGVDALQMLLEAHSRATIFDLPGAQDEARRAGESFAALGDDQHVAEANATLSDLWAWQRTASAVALGGGALIVAGAVAVMLRRRRRAARVGSAVYVGEENRSWL